MKNRNLLTNLLTLTYLLIVFTLNVKAQNIGINSTGATPNSSAMLDIDVSAMASKKGLLIPRVALTGTSDVTTISSPATSLMIYNTATAGISPNNVVPGYYFWNGIKWIQILTNGGSGSIWSRSDTFVTLSNIGDFVGFGTVNPEAEFHMETGNILIGNGVNLMGRSSFSGDNKVNILGVYNNDLEIGKNMNFESLGAIKLFVPIANTSYPDDGKYEIYGPNSSIPMMQFNENGRIGINTANPEAELHMETGNILIGNGVNLMGRSSFSGDNTVNILGVYNNDLEIGKNMNFESLGAIKLFVPIANTSYPDDGKYEIYGPNTSIPMMLFNENGKIGINNSSPNASLDIVGTFRLSNGAEGSGKVLTSDASGNATWQALNTSATAWQLTGNIGTIDGTDFIGTTDNKPINFRINNQKAGRINSNGQTIIGYQAGNSNTEMTTTSFGYQALFSNTTGPNNCAFGYKALYSNIVGAGNVAIGNFALNSNLSDLNTAVGISSLSNNNTGFCNTAVGHGSLSANNSGLNNTSIGAASGKLSTGSNNVFFGYQAGDNLTTGNKNIIIGTDIDFPVSTGSNQLNIGNIIFGTGINGTGTTVSSGNIGIGTISPTAKLEVFNSTGASLTEMQVNSNGITDADFILKTTNTNMGWFGGGSTNKLAAWNYTNNTEPLTILGVNGYVGIGATSPSEKLTVSGAETAAHGKNAAIGIINTSAPGTGWYLRAGAAGTVTPNGGFSIADNNAYRFCIDNAGNVGIGTTAPSERLYVMQTSDANKNVIFGYANQTSSTVDYQNTGVTGFGQGNGIASSYGYGFGIKGIGSTSGYGAVGVYAAIGTTIPNPTLFNNFYAIYADAITTGANRYAGVFMNGNVGIGCANPQYKLHVIGDIASSTAVRAPAAFIVGAITACSDVRFKKDFTEIENPLQRLLKMHGYNYYWKKDEFPDRSFNSEKQIGFKAQEMQTILPEIVVTDNDGYLSIDYSKLSPIIVEAIKEQQKQIEELKTIVTEQQKQINLLINH